MENSSPYILNSTQNSFPVEKRERLANSIIFFAEKIHELSKTKLLKLLYLLEECYVRRYAIPFLDIDFEVWQAGPVNRQTYIELSDVPVLLDGYIRLEVSDCNTTIKPIKGFSDDEFSDNELEMMEFVLSSFGNKTAAELVAYTHKPNSPWFILAEQNGLLRDFELKIKTSSEVKIDLESFFCTDEFSKNRYEEQKQFNAISQYYSI